MSGPPARAARGADIVPAVSVSLRAATRADCRDAWLWRNDPETRQASFDSAPIEYDTHERWFDESLARTDRKLYVVVADDRAVGVARLDLHGGTGTVSLHLAAEWRGRRIGPAALRALADIAFGPLGLDRLDASIKADNTRSLAAFERAGFVRRREGPVVELQMVRHAR